MRTLFLLLVCLLPALAAAEPAAPPTPALPSAATKTLSVDDAVALALKQNPRAVAASQSVLAGRSGVRAARALSNPSIVATPGIAGPSPVDQELSVSQPLEINGVRGARTRLAQAELRAGQSEAVITTRDLIRDVKRAYYELARAQEVLDLQQGSVATAAEFERIARRQVEVGTRSGIDLTQLQVELTRARGLQLQAQAGVRLAAAALNTLLGQPPDTPLSLSSLAFSGRRTEDVPSVATAFAQRAEVSAAQAELERLKQQARLVQAEGRPDLALTGRMESFTDSPRVGGVGIGITLPFLDWGSRRNRLEQLKQQSTAQSALVASTRAQVRLDLEQALTRLRTAEELVTQYEQGLLDQARRLAEAERTRFQTGAGSPLTVLEAQRTYRSVASDYYGALSAHEQAKADLEWAMGSAPVPDVLRPTADDRKEE